MNLPEKYHPLFALPGHEWRDADDLIQGDFICEKDGWNLIRRTPLKVSAETAEKNLQNPGKLARYVAKTFGLPDEWKKTLIAYEVQDSLATLIEKTWAKRQFAEERERKRAVRSGHKFTTSPELNKLDNKISTATGLLCHLVLDGCSRLTRLAEKHPNTFQKEARVRVEWPVMMSLHPGYGTPKPLDLLKALQLGRDTGREIHQAARGGTRSEPRSKGTKEIADELLYCLQAERENTDGLHRNRASRIRLPIWFLDFSRLVFFIACGVRTLDFQRIPAFKCVKCTQTICTKRLDGFCHS